MEITRKKYLYFLLGILLLASCNSAKLSDARSQYLRGEYFAASETYRKVYRSVKPDERPLRGVVAYEMAETYHRMNSATRAATAYANAIRYNYPDTLMYLRYAQMLHKEGKYLLAEKAYNDFLKLDSMNSLGLTGLQGVKNAIVWKENPTRHVVKRMDLFNSNRGEFSPMFAQDDAVLYITSSREDACGDSLSDITGMKNNDIFIVTKNDKGEWQKPAILESEINTRFDEGTPSISADGSYLFYTFSPVDYNRATTTKIYYSQRGSGSWNAGQELTISMRDTLSLFAHPSVSPSGDYLYFVSDMPGGYGGKDIWRAGMDGNMVLFTENLGSEINTAGDEVFPYIKNDSTLYFSSDGHAGMGGLDLFEARLQKNNRWMVTNMGFPVNSSMDDFGITFEKNGKRGFLSSNRDDARGRDHIYSFEYPDVDVFVEGFAVDREDKFIPGAKISVISADGSQHEYITKQDGTYKFNANRGATYLFMASVDGFLNLKKSLKTSVEEKDTVYFVDFEMTPYNKPVILENIFYDFDKATLRPESKEELDGLIALLNDNPSVAIELSAHTDRKGSEEYNQNLSLRRAQSVVRYLTDNGINDGRLSAVGFGKTQPKTVSASIAKKYDFLKEDDLLDEAFIENLPPEQQEIADQINRRTEFKIFDTDFGLW
ncbi:MAG: OmpA family protein [Bacteroidia bacterium]|nr:OmpA family protein [Bacteroidia bacterium]